MPYVSVTTDVDIYDFIRDLKASELGDLIEDLENRFGPGMIMKHISPGLHVGKVGKLLNHLKELEATGKEMVALLLK